MRFEFKPSFDRSLKSFRGEDKEALKKVAIQVVDILSREQTLHQGFGLKRLRGHFWEVRKGLKARVLFRWQGDLVEFVLAGDHDDIKRFLKHLS